VAVISGASRGFGQAIAVRFVEEGARVAMVDFVSCRETLDLIASIPGLGAPVAEVRKCGEGRQAGGGLCARLRVCLQPGRLAGAGSVRVRAPAVCASHLAC
jgi:NAD(P)-dependent dehydrogenase (short-subunit alcohol dehydrogenase family)